MDGRHQNHYSGLFSADYDQAAGADQSCSINCKPEDIEFSSPFAPATDNTPSSHIQHHTTWPISWLQSSSPFGLSSSSHHQYTNLPTSQNGDPPPPCFDPTFAQLQNPHLVEPPSPLDLCSILNHPSRSPNSPPPATCHLAEVMSPSSASKRRRSRINTQEASSPRRVSRLGRSESGHSTVPDQPSGRQFKRPRFTATTNPLSIANLVSDGLNSPTDPPAGPTDAPTQVSGAESTAMVDLPGSVADNACDPQLEVPLTSNPARTSQTTPDSRSEIVSATIAAAAATSAAKQARLQDFECCICMSPPTDLTMTPCGHLFCWECIHRAANAGNSHFGGRGPGGKTSKCPNCRKPFTTHIFSEKGLIPLSIRVRRRRRKPSHGGGGEDGGLFVPDRSDRGKTSNERTRMAVKGGRLVAAPVIELD